MKNEYQKYLCCPYCKSDLDWNEAFFSCSVCERRYETDDGILSMPLEVSGDKQISINKWDEEYQKTGLEKHLADFHEYRKRFFHDVYANIVSEKKIGKDTVYLEIGCGPFYFGSLIARDANLIIGVDFSLAALKLAKRLFEKENITNYILIQSDIFNMPLRDDTVDLIYGGGVIEHFKDTQTCVNELFRVLRTGGVCMNSVPYLNLASLTYRQLWGNIPNVPLLKQLAEFVHITVLRKKHMIFGYELSFLGSTLKKIHKKAGFSTVKIDKFDIDLSFEFMPKMLRPFFVSLARNSRFFWPMIKVVGIKENL